MELGPYYKAYWNVSRDCTQTTKCSAKENWPTFWHALETDRCHGEMGSISAKKRCRREALSRSKASSCCSYETLYKTNDSKTSKAYNKSH
jgi:hypothetical protein